MAKSDSRRRGSDSGVKPTRPTKADIRRVLGDLNDDDVVRVLETAATMDELQQAAAALNGELPGHIGRPVEGAAARIYNMLVVEEPEDPRGGSRGGPSVA